MGGCLFARTKGVFEQKRPVLELQTVVPGDGHPTNFLYNYTGQWHRDFVKIPLEIGPGILNRDLDHPFGEAPQRGFLKDRSLANCLTRKEYFYHYE